METEDDEDDGPVVATTPDVEELDEMDDDKYFARLFGFVVPKMLAFSFFSLIFAGLELVKVELLNIVGCNGFKMLE